MDELELLLEEAAEFFLNIEGVYWPYADFLPDAEAEELELAIEMIELLLEVVSWLSASMISSRNFISLSPNLFWPILKKCFEQ